MASVQKSHAGGEGESIVICVLKLKNYDHQISYWRSNSSPYGDAVVGGLTAYELPMFGKEVRELFLYEIGVTESHWRQGIARALIEALKQTCVERGVEVIFVGTEMDNEAAKQLYANTGGTLKVIAWYEYDL